MSKNAQLNYKALFFRAFTPTSKNPICSCLSICVWLSALCVLWSSWFDKAIYYSVWIMMAPRCSLVQMTERLSPCQCQCTQRDRGTGGMSWSPTPPLPGLGFKKNKLTNAVICTQCTLRPGSDMQDVAELTQQFGSLVSVPYQPTRETRAIWICKLFYVLYVWHCYWFVPFPLPVPPIRAALNNVSGKWLGTGSCPAPPHLTLPEQRYPDTSWRKDFLKKTWNGPIVFGPLSGPPKVRKILTRRRTRRRSTLSILCNDR